MEFTKEMEAWLDRHQEELKQLIRQLCAIPAPSRREEERAAFCAQWFRQAGAEEVYVDEALNVVCPVGVTGDGPVAVVMAHTDTVFPDTQPMPFLEDETHFYCPGVCDDTANLAVMMLCAKYFLEKKAQPRTGILFVANSCEEGLGNLKGCREIMAKYGSRVQELVTFDGMSLNALVDEAVGSHRYAVTVKTEGGHSFNAFGNRNAIAWLSEIITKLYEISVPVEGTSKTTYNVGLISGGTSVNTIAQSAQMLYEYRSDNRNCLAKMQALFEDIIADYRAKGLEIEVELLGERPCAGELDLKAKQALRDKAERSIRRITGLAPVCRSGSTDCNIPLSMGIPAICLGVCKGSGAHTREEALELSSLPAGCRLCMDFLCQYF